MDEKAGQQRALDGGSIESVSSTTKRAPALGFFEISRFGSTYSFLCMRSLAKRASRELPTDSCRVDIYPNYPQPPPHEHPPKTVVSTPLLLRSGTCVHAHSPLVCNCKCSAGTAGIDSCIDCEHPAERTYFELNEWVVTHVRDVGVSSPFPWCSGVYYSWPEPCPWGSSSCAWDLPAAVRCGAVAALPPWAMPPWANQAAAMLREGGGPKSMKPRTGWT